MKKTSILIILSKITHMIEILTNKIEPLTSAMPHFILKNFEN